MDRRKSSFNERLATILVIGGILGAMLVLIDPIVQIAFANGVSVKIGGTGFSDQLKGAVVTLVIVGGFSAVINYYFGSSNADKVKNQTIANLAATTATANTATEKVAPAADVISEVQPIGEKP